MANIPKEKKNQESGSSDIKKCKHKENCNQTHPRKTEDTWGTVICGYSQSTASLTNMDERHAQKYQTKEVWYKKYMGCF